MAAETPSGCDLRLSPSLAVPGKPVGLHSLRHSYCTSLVRSGAEIEKVRALAGHSSIVVSQRYLWSDTESRRAVDHVRDGRKRSEGAPPV